MIYTTQLTQQRGSNWWQNKRGVIKVLCYTPEVKKWREVKVAQSCPTLCDPMEYTVHGILQARILEWVAFPFSRGSSQPRDRTQVSWIADRFFTSSATRESIHPKLIPYCKSTILQFSKKWEGRVARVLALRRPEKAGSCVQGEGLARV